MATAIATKPAPPHQKIKRPPPPAVQTSINGARSSQTSPSPSVGAMRAPSGLKHPPSATNVNGGTGSAGSRSSNRRRDVRAGKAGQGDSTLGGKIQKKVMEPYGELSPGSGHVGMYRVPMLTGDLSSENDSGHTEEVQEGESESIHRNTLTSYPLSV